MRVARSLIWLSKERGYMKKTKKPLKFQASSISRIMKCPGSATLDRDCPDRLRYFAFKDAADFGTLCHAAGEMRLLKKGKLCLDTMMRINEHPRGDDVFYISGEYYTAVNELKTPGKLHVEEKFRATIAGVDCVAKSDAFFVGKKYLRKFDLKSGNFDYAESAGMQMDFASQLYLYINDFPDRTLYDTVTVQPAYYNEARRVIISEVARFHRGWFEEFISGLAKRQKELNPGSHCKFCGAILTCPKVKKLTEEFFEMSKANKETLEFKRIYEMKDAVVAFLDALDGYLKNELESGKQIPGLFLDETSGHRRWIDAGEVEEKLSFLGDKRYKPRELKTPAQMEKLAGRENIAGLYDSPRLKKVAIRVNNFDSFDE